MKDLKLHVERIVRPIRGSLWRKNRMREELLAHLLQKQEALVGAGAGEPAARATAIEELGDPADLRDGLQATVPLLERLAFVNLPDFRFLDTFFDKKEGESSFHFARVRAAFIALVVGTFLLAILGVRWLHPLPGSRNPVRGPGSCVMMLSYIYAWTVASSFIAYYAADATGLRRVLSKTSAFRGWLKGGALCLFLCVYLTLMLAPVVLFKWFDNPSDGRILVAVFANYRLGLGLLAGLLVLFVFSSIAMKFEHEQWAKWGRLRIDE